MPTLEELAREFLDQRRVAVAGVSRKSGEAANIIFRKLRDSGHEVYPLNPRAEALEGVACYPNLAELPCKVDACVIATPPSVAEAIVDQCAELGVRWVWMHRSMGKGSVSEAAVDKCRKHDINVIPGACPMMYCEPVDFGHKCIRWLLKMSGRLPMK